MDFGRKQLEKYGWTDGKGLGKNEDGISKALKPKLKFDNHGIGHDPAEHFTNNWWEHVYNQAASNIKVNNNNGNVDMQVNSNKPFNITTKKYLLNSDTKTTNGFIKKSKLIGNGLVDIDMGNSDILEAAVAPAVQVLSDDELFAACGGRTAHKGARHGLKQNGKLSRIEKQEKLLLRKLKNVSLSDDECIIKKKAKKVSKHKEKFLQNQTTTETNTKKKKKQKSRRSVSFNETVTEYYWQELDATAQSIDDSDGSAFETVSVILESWIKDTNDNEVPHRAADDSSVPDEGIEQDFEDDEGARSFGHESFEEQQVNTVEKLSKEERKLLKTKRKMERECDRARATARFLKEIGSVDLEDIDMRVKRNKRKLKALKHEEVLSKKQHHEMEVPNKSRNKMSKRQKEEKQMNSIVQALDQVCKISELE